MQQKRIRNTKYVIMNNDDNGDQRISLYDNNIVVAIFMMGAFSKKRFERGEDERICGEGWSKDMQLRSFFVPLLLVFVLINELTYVTRCI